VSPSAKIAGSGVTQHSHVKSKGLNALSVMVLINLNITGNSDGVVKLTLRLTPLGWKQRRANHALIPSSAPTAKGTTKSTQTLVLFGGITSTENGMSKSMLRYMKTDLNPSAPK